MNNPFPAIATDLRETVDRAQTLLAELSDAQTNQGSQPGKWTKKEILGHLLDSASNNHQRFVRAALQGDLVFPGYDQEGLVTLQRFGDLQWRFLVEFWAGYNRFLAHVISVMPSQSSGVTCAIGKNQPATLEWIAQDYVAHLKRHLNQILGQRF